MKKTITSVLLVVIALSTNVVLSQDMPFKSRAYSFVADGANKTGTLIGSGFEKTKNIVSKVPGVTFVGNNKLNVCYVIIGAYAIAESVNWYQGKTTYARQLTNHASATPWGIEVVNCLSLVATWLSNKTAAAKQSIAKFKESKTATKEEVTALSNKVTELETTVKNLTNILQTYAPVDTVTNLFKELNIDQLLRRINELENQVKLLTPKQETLV